MADQQLNIKLNAIDNASKALTDIKNSIFNVRNALIGLGAGVVVNSLVNIGKEADDVRGRLNQLSKAGYGGSQAFDQLTKFAIDAKIPLLDVFQASGDLLAISKSPEELAKNLQIASNASAYFKISFVEASDQVAKALLKGIDSARLFQDKGIKSLRGFGEFADKSFEGVGRSLERNFGANGVFGKTNQELKDGLSGTIIALDNRFKQFQITIAQGFFDSLTKELGDLEIFLKNNNKAVDDLAKNIGEALGKAVIALGKAVVFVKDNFDILVNLFFSFIGLKAGQYIYELVGAFEALGIALKKLDNDASKNRFFLLLGLLAGFVVSVEDFRKKFGHTNTEVENLNQSLDDTSQLLDSIPKTWQDILKYTKESNKEQLTFSSLFSNVAQKNIDSIKKLEEGFTDLEAVSKLVTENLDKGVKAFSRGLAESIVLGKGLEETFRKFVQETAINMIATIAELIIRTYILKKLFEALGLPVDDANNSSKQLKGTSLDIFGINTANYGIQILTTAEIEKQNALLAQRQAMGGGGGSGGGGLFGSLLNIGMSLFSGGANAGDAIYTDYPINAEGGAVRGGMPTVVGERGRELFVPSSNGTIVPNQDLGGGNNITFNIQANDVRGIRELLIDNRATIINLVNQGANAKGRSNVV
jgi:hypothetical protein